MILSLNLRPPHTHVIIRMCTHVSTHMENHAYIHTYPYACKHIHICAFMAYKEKTPLMYRSPSHPPKDPDSHKLWLNRVPDSLWICLLLQKLLPWDLWPVRKWNSLFIRVAPTHSESRKAETLCVFLGMQSSLKGSEALLLLHREHTCAYEGFWGGRHGFPPLPRPSW